MKILVYAHELEVGGTQVNAIDLASKLRDNYGHEIVFFAAPGPMVNLVKERKLHYVPGPQAWFHPSIARIRALRALVKKEAPDVIHAWDWWQCLDAYYGAFLPMRIPLLVTDMAMGIQRLLPKRVYTTFGTPELVDRARECGRVPVELLLPPVDLNANRPGRVDSREFRRLFLTDNAINLVIVSRLASCLKGEGLRRSIQAVGTLAQEMPLNLIIVGEGDARQELEALAAEVNKMLGRKAIVFAGPLLDPRVAYSAADIVLGMGSSALRALAFGKPLVVVGERGFAAPFLPETAESFYYRGMYGLGDGEPSNIPLVNAISRMVRELEKNQSLSEFCRAFVAKHFDLEAITGQLENLLKTVAAERTSIRVGLVDGLRTAAIWARERRFAYSGVRKPNP